MALWIKGLRRCNRTPVRGMAGEEEAAAKLMRFNPRLPEGFARDLAHHATRPLPG
ncbi:MAG: hypothetical protein D6812_13645, partial [Deltaproteobacteria bacterium]